MSTAYLNRIATAVPEHDLHDSFVIFAEKMLAKPRLRAIFRRMANRADIAHRYSFLDPKADGQFSSRDANEFYRLGDFPSTSQRMELFEQSAPKLMRKVVDKLALSEEERAEVTHVLVTCCTGLYAPGLDSPRGLREPIHIVDVGCGGGDLLRQISRRARRREIAVELTGIDLNPYATRAAAEVTPKEFGITWVTGDAMLHPPERKVDIVVSSLTAHHLEDVEVAALLKWMEATAQIGWFINDLERAEWSYRMFGWARWHPIVRHDGPVSFRKVFRKEDWVRLLAAAEISQEKATLERRRPGRLCVGRWKLCR